MSTRNDIKLFLRDPKGFAATLPGEDATLWRQGLDDVVEPAIRAREPERPLRQAQREAWIGLADQRVGLILGPPGTGKTHALSWMTLGYLEACRRNGTPCRTLVTAFTRNAVANLLENITQRVATHLTPPVPVYFLGRPAGPLPEGVEVLALPTKNNIEELWEKITTPHAILGCTVWGLNRLLKLAPQPPSDGHTAALFRLVCIDEASQLVVSQGLMALAGLCPGGRVLVAGDDRQLPPVRAEHDHQLEGPRLGGSLYAFLRSCETREFPLDETFRLNAPLTRFPQRQFYAGHYRSAEPVRERRLALQPDWRKGLEEWEQHALDPEYPLCVLVHDGPPAATSNPFEASLAARLARLLRERMPPADDTNSDAAFWTDSLAIISPHRAQNTEIRARLNDKAGKTVVVETVDRIQGKERDAIIASYTVSDPEFALVEAGFIFSPQRLNVTVTRARSKFILVIARRLLDAVPADQEQLDAAQTLREFIFSAREAGRIELPAADGRPIPVTVRLGGFNEDNDLPQIATPARKQAEDLPPMDDWLEGLLIQIRQEASNSPYGTAADYRLAKALARSSETLLPGLIVLHRHGHISLLRKEGKFGPFWTARPLDPPRTLFDLDPQALPVRLEEVIQQTRKTRFAPAYDNIRDRFDWWGPDGQDRLRPLTDQLQADGLITYERSPSGQLRVDLQQPQEDEAKTTPPPPIEEVLADQDFRILNRLEDLEARRINFGIFEDWHSIRDMARDLDLSQHAVAAAVRRLELHGHLMYTDDGRLRSRMAELAREIRYVKQRFTPDNADQRPFLVRGLKIELRDRDKPRPTQPLSVVIPAVRDAAGNDPLFSKALDAVAAMLTRDWNNPDPTLRGFQARALLALVPAWLGIPGTSERFVITADTGAGKTEAACLPLIIGALHDRMCDIQGTRAILVYPRVRLAANQAQRLARYLAELAQDTDLPLITLGLQNGDVPWSFDNPAHLNQELWKPGTGPAGYYEFPFFHCPKCEGPLQLGPHQGVAAADRLLCTAVGCGWQFNGWIGSKRGLIETPPALFLPTTESLHQWLGDPRYARLFGDHLEYAPPRALLADEIHLYSHIHGAQIGYALRRLIARTDINGGACLAIGMSATLGEPAEVWRALTGGEAVTPIRVEENEREPSIQGREYFFFVQPEVESRGRDIAGASSTIQSLMVLAHGMRRRTGKEGGFRGIVFLDSIDKVKRLHHDYLDAEQFQKLARLRTAIYPERATGDIRKGCCQQPVGCDCFMNGECWYFAANDKRQWTATGPYRPGSGLQVANTPVWSGAGGRVEERIRASDIVFATSSLEVGYDDPDMALVYQHYAPVNLASFIQRKGRGGRGADDRPLTGITLSPYSARDSWYFRKPQALLDAGQFDVPLNMSNHAVVRGQAVALVLDMVARHEARTDTPAFETSGDLHPEVAAGADEALQRVFGAAIYLLLETESIATLWRTIQRLSAQPLQRIDNAPKRREAAAWVPRMLFETVNLPELQVLFERQQEKVAQAEDIALALNNIAPGNMTHRYGTQELHWCIPRHGRQPWLSAEDIDAAEQLDFGDVEELLRLLPLEARREIGNRVTPYVLRPRHVRVSVGGYQRGEWTALWQVDAHQQVQPVGPGNQPDTPDDVRVHHKSSGQLRGFPVIQVEAQHARQHDAGPLAGLAERIDVYAGGVLADNDSGLQLARIFWGADSEVRFCAPRAPSLPFSQLFTHPRTGDAALFGYRMTTEGVRFHIDSANLSRFVEDEVVRISEKDSVDGNWYRLQMLRHIVQRRARGIGMNGYHAQRVAELIAAAAGHPVLRKKLQQLLKLWDKRRLQALFMETYRQVLHQHPLLTERRVLQVAEAAADDNFKELLAKALEGVRSANYLAMYLRSLILHGIAIRLKHAFVLHGRGDERRVLCHARLPVQFAGDADDIVTVAENGERGDGTTRTFEARLNQALTHLADGFLTECPNAVEDALMARVWAMPEKHDQWRALDPRDPETLTHLQTALEFGERSDVPVHALLRLLYGTETIGVYEFAYYDLWREAKQVEEALHRQSHRQPSTWELVSTVVGHARDNADDTPTAAALLRSYADIEDASQEDNLSAEARLADQIYRISGHLCVDGCQACLHTGSDIVGPGMVEAATSRRLLERFVNASLRQ